MWVMRSLFLGALAIVSMVAATSVGSARDVGPDCVRWKEYRFSFAEGQAELTAEEATRLADMVKATGRECGFRIYATAFEEGAGVDADAISLKRRDAVVDALLKAEVGDGYILPLNTWVEKSADDPAKARSAAVYTFPEQGMRCGREAAQKISDALELWFDNGSVVISKPRLRDMQTLVDSVLATDCNVGVAAYSATEVSGGSKVAEKNRQIAKMRSKAVIDALRQAGLPADRIVETGTYYVGDAQPNKLSTRRAVITVM